MPECKSKRLSNEKLILPDIANKSLSLKLVWINNSRIRLEFKGSCLEQNNASSTANNVVNLFVVHELNRWSKDFNVEFTLTDCLF